MYIKYGGVKMEGFLNECDVLTAKYLTEIFSMDQVNAVGRVCTEKPTAQY